jgi:exodeoxyribonuclease VII small subunit
MDAAMTYNKAFTELQTLVRQIENEDIQLDTLADKVKEANELIKYCETKLRVIEEDVKRNLSPALSQAEGEVE